MYIQYVVPQWEKSNVEDMKGEYKEGAYILGIGSLWYKEKTSGNVTSYKKKGYQAAHLEVCWMQQVDWEF